MAKEIKTFTKSCFCKKESVEFVCDSKFNETIISEVYCPTCSDRAADDSLLIKIMSIPRMIGIWGVKYNKEVLKELDTEYKDKEEYFVNVFERKCGFKAIPERTRQAFYEVVGMKGDLSHHKGEDVLSGPDKKMIEKDGKPTKLPKKTRSGPEESYTPFSGYKGHH